VSLPSVYVCAASSEAARAARAMDAVRAAGFDVAHDWLAAIVAAGVAANPPDASRDQRARWGADCLYAVRAADAVWLLAPDAPTAGAWIEFGYALARGLPTVVSGPNCAASIFCALASEVATDDQALAMLRGWLAP
jgi:hypothetical protein